MAQAHFQPSLFGHLNLSHYQNKAHTLQVRINKSQLAMK